MGLCDYITVEGQYAGCNLPPGSRCQSKSLYADGSEFVITADGKLLQRLFRYEHDRVATHSVASRPLTKRIPIGDQVIEYHGDILMYIYREGDNTLQEWVARFTHGRLEWIRPLATYPEASRLLLTEQGAR